MVWVVWLDVKRHLSKLFQEPRPSGDLLLQFHPSIVYIMYYSSSERRGPVSVQADEMVKLYSDSWNGARALNLELLRLCMCDE